MWNPFSTHRTPPATLSKPVVRAGLHPPTSASSLRTAPCTRTKHRSSPPMHHLDSSPYASDHSATPTPSPSRQRRPSRSSKASSASRNNSDVVLPSARSRSRRRTYRLPSPPAQAECPCCNEDAAAALSGGTAENAELTGDGGKRGRRGRPSASALQPHDVDGDTGDDEGNLASSGSGESFDSMSSSSTSAAPPPPTRARLFSDSDDDEDDVLARSMTTDDSDSLQSSSFSPGTPSSWFSPPQHRLLDRSPSSRKSSITRLAVSDPLLCPTSASPIFSFGASRSSRRGSGGGVEGWLPAPPEATSFAATKSPELPDTPSLPAVTPPPSPPRRVSPPVSLLTKSLSLFGRLPNLAPLLPSPESYLAHPSVTPDELAKLEPGWGPKERRRVLDAEPSHAADEARMFTHARRRKDANILADEVEAAAVGGVAAVSFLSGGLLGGGLALDSLDSAGAKVITPPDSPTSPTADVLPLPHLLTTTSLSSSPPSPASSVADIPLPSSPRLADSLPLPPPLPPTSASSTSVSAAVDAAATPAPPPPPPRFISNTRHLLMLSLEFEMMRHAKIRGPLKQRAVTIRAASPPRGSCASGSSVRESALRWEVC